MKRIAIFLITLVAFVACEDSLKETPQIQDAGTLEVSFAYGENDDIVSHTFSPTSQSIDVEVQMNTQVGWKVSSDADWCVVDNEEKHRGSGTFTLAVTANDGFTDRNDATVTLSAGDFTKQLRVIQRGNVFIIDKVYKLSNRTAGSVDLSVRMLENTQWHLECPDWVTYDLGEPSVVDGESRTTVTFEWGENNVESRFCNIGFVEDGVAGAAIINFSLYQFGNEYETTEDGSVLLEAKKAGALTPEAQNADTVEVVVPINVFTRLECPEWVGYEKVDNEDKTVTWYLYFAHNPSDTESQRDTELKFIGETEVTLPVIIQKYYPVHGLVSAEGFKMFAQQFNSGGDLSSWVKDGKVSVVGHVNMTGLEDWIPIGTEERPFNLEFDGGFRNISYFKTSMPLFGVCKGATIRSLTFSETCSYVCDANFIDNVRLALLAGSISETTVTDCSSFASLKLDASAVETGRMVYVGGLVGEADEKSLIKDCSVEGDIVLSSTSKCQGGRLCVGGLVGYLSGDISGCSSKMNILDGMGVSEHNVGGVTGYLSASGAITDCINSGNIVYTALRRVDEIDRFSDCINLGGIVGYSEGELHRLENAGSIEINSDVRWQYVGGIAGMIKNSGKASALINSAGKIDSYNKGQQLCLGGLIGCVNKVDLQLDLSDVAGSVVDMKIKPTSSELDAGGLIGRSYNRLEIKNPAWKGNISYDISAENSKLTATFGGIVGRANYLAIEGANVSGSIRVKPNASFKNEGLSVYGGIAGRAETGALLTACTSACDIKWEGDCSRINGNVCCLGGIIARIDQGVAKISGCVNSGALWNRYINANKWSKGANVSCSVTGGIVGCYGATTGLDPLNSNIEIIDCSNSGVVQTSRGLCGGIAGALMNANVKACTFTGQIPYVRSYHNPLTGGVVGAVENSIIEDCTVTADLYGNSVQAVAAYIGGVAAFLCSKSKIRNCLYFGHITTNESSNAGFGISISGIAAVADEDCSISGCGVGGTVCGTTVTTDNYTGYVVGDGAAQITDCNYWNGK